MLTNTTEGDDEDAAIEAFLQLLEQDIATHPERLRGLPQGLHQRLLKVTAGLEVNPDEPIEGPVAL